MSSLSASQADGYYAPPEYYESGRYLKESRNKFVGSKGHNQYEQRGIVRFELPYHGTCTGTDCGAPVGKGTRFNAVKKQEGAYFTTPIWEFTMKCRICAKVEFRIRTNPKEQGFDYMAGIHKKITEFDTVEAGSAGVIDTNNANGNHKIVSSGEYVHVSATSTKSDSGLERLEKIASGKRRVMTERDALEARMMLNYKTFYNDAASNATIRKTFRIDRNRKKKRLESAKALGWKAGMEVLEDSTVGDAEAARETVFKDCRRKERDHFRKLRTSSIFSPSSMGTKQIVQKTGVTKYCCRTERDHFRKLRTSSIFSPSSAVPDKWQNRSTANTRVKQQKNCEISDSLISTDCDQKLAPPLLVLSRVDVSVKDFSLDATAVQSQGNQGQSSLATLVDYESDSDET